MEFDLSHLSAIQHEVQKASILDCHQRCAIRETEEGIINSLLSSCQSRKRYLFLHYFMNHVPANLDLTYLNTLLPSEVLPFRCRDMGLISVLQRFNSNIIDLVTSLLSVCDRFPVCLDAITFSFLPGVFGLLSTFSSQSQFLSFLREVEARAPDKCVLFCRLIFALPEVQLFLTSVFESVCIELRDIRTSSDARRFLDGFLSSGCARFGMLPPIVFKLLSLPNVVDIFENSFILELFRRPTSYGLQDVCDSFYRLAASATLVQAELASSQWVQQFIDSLSMFGSVLVDWIQSGLDVCRNLSHAFFLSDFDRSVLSLMGNRDEGGLENPCVFTCVWCSVASTDMSAYESQGRGGGALIASLTRQILTSTRRIDCHRNVSITGVQSFTDIIRPCIASVDSADLRLRLALLNAAVSADSDVDFTTIIPSLGTPPKDSWLPGLKVIQKQLSTVEYSIRQMLKDKSLFVHAIQFEKFICDEPLAVPEEAKTNDDGLKAFCGTLPQQVPRGFSRMVLCLELMKAFSYKKFLAHHEDYGRMDQAFAEWAAHAQHPIEPERIAIRDRAIHGDVVKYIGEAFQFKSPLRVFAKWRAARVVIDNLYKSEGASKTGPDDLVPIIIASVCAAPPARFISRMKYFMACLEGFSEEGLEDIFSDLFLFYDVVKLYETQANTREFPQ
jgi:hypothetical protein